MMLSFLLLHIPHTLTSVVTLASLCHTSCAALCSYANVLVHAIVLLIPWILLHTRTSTTQRSLIATSLWTAAQSFEMLLRNIWMRLITPVQLMRPGIGKLLCPALWATSRLALFLGPNQATSRPAGRCVYCQPLLLDTMTGPQMLALLMLKTAFHQLFSPA